MQVTVKLHGIMRDRVPEAERGMLTLELGDGATLADVVDVLADKGLTRPFLVGVNGQIANDDKKVLADGDRVDVFRAGAGGSCVIGTPGSA